ncbi:unnamed protein product [Schistosoma guineensis]|nr:unnamed protein product [Schistosoma guineensis]
MGEISCTSASVEKLKQELRIKDEENRATKVSLEQANRHLQITEGKLKDCQAKLDQPIEVNESITDKIHLIPTEVKLVFWHDLGILSMPRDRQRIHLDLVH